MLFRYRGSDTGNRWSVVRAGGRRHAAYKVTYRAGLFMENVFYFRQGGACQNLNGRKPTHARWKHDVNYRNTGGRWSGFGRSDHFAVRWTGRMRIFRTGHYRFSIISDDGSNLWIDNRYTINNNGLHGWRNREATKRLGGGWHLVRLEMFEHGGHAGMLFRYRGPDTGNRWTVARAGGRKAPTRHKITYRAGLFMENVFYFRQGRNCQNLNGRRPNMARWKHDINYRNTGGKWSGFHRSDHFAVRWTGRMRFYKTGHYHFQIISDDGSNFWLDNRYTINNNGLHGWRARHTRKHVRAGWHLVRIEMFERGGHAGMLFRYHGPDTGNRWVVARASGRRGGRRGTAATYRAGLFRENVYYFGQGGRCQNLNG